MERFPENNERVKRQKELPIRVIVGNPPYSVGQASGNDNNQNLKYPHLDKRIEETYAAATAATNKNSLYDSYIRAIRLASDRIGDKGVVCFVSNGGFIDGNTADGLRKCLADEFSQISVFNLRGIARTAGEQRRKERGNVFGSGGRITIAITLLVKDPESTGQARLLYRDIGDYLTREEKLAVLAEHESFGHLDLTEIVPNEDGDWLNQRNPVFGSYPPIGSKDKTEPEVPVFKVYSAGLQTNRDAWVFNFSQEALEENVKRMISNYNDEVNRWQDEGGGQSVEEFVDKDPTRICATKRSTANHTARGRILPASRTSDRRARRRPWLHELELVAAEGQEAGAQICGRIPNMAGKPIAFLGGDRSRYRGLPRGIH